MNNSVRFDLDCFSRIKVQSYCFNYGAVRIGNHGSRTLLRADLLNILLSKCHRDSLLNTTFCVGEMFRAYYQIFHLISNCWHASLA